MSLEELRLRLKLEAGDVITEDWYNDLVEYLSLIEQGGAIDYDGYIHKDLIPDSDSAYSIGTADYRLKEVHATSGYFDSVNSRTGEFSESLTVQGKTVLKDEDPIHIASFFDYAKSQLQEAVQNAITSWSSSPLRLNDNSFAVGSRFEERIEQGLAFSVSKRFENVASDTVVEILFSNPNGSGKTVYIVAIEIIATGQGFVDIYRDVTIETAGIQLNVMNLNLGSTNVSSCVIETGGTYTNGTLAHQTVVYGGTKVNAVGSLAEVGERIIIPEGRNFMIQFVNKAQTSIDLSIRILWWED